MKYDVISADGHVDLIWLPPDLFTAEAPRELTLVATEITASVAITDAPSRPAAIKSDSRITPEPEVPPTTTP